MDMTPEKALKGFGSGINCAMLVFSNCASGTGLDEKTAMKIAAGFGGGMGHGNVCGCVTGALMALGMKYGNCEPGDRTQMAIFNEKKKLFEEKFTEKFGSVICREMQGGLDPNSPAEAAKIAEKGLTLTVCAPAVCEACKILKEIMDEN